jgi:hypothetical protein
MPGVLGAVTALEAALTAAPALAASVSDLIALIKRGASGGPEPTAQEIATAQQATQDKLAQIQADIDAGDLS